MSLPDLADYPLPGWAPPNLSERQLTILRALKLVLDREPEFILQLIPIFKQYCPERVEFLRLLDDLAARWQTGRGAGTKILSDGQSAQISEGTDPC